MSSTGSKCCLKCSVQMEDDKPCIPCEHCECHDASPETPANPPCGMCHKDHEGRTWCREEDLITPAEPPMVCTCSKKPCWHFPDTPAETVSVKYPDGSVHEHDAKSVFIVPAIRVYIVTSNKELPLEQFNSILLENMATGNVSEMKGAVPPTETPAEGWEKIIEKIVARPSGGLISVPAQEMIDSAIAELKSLIAHTVATAQKKAREAGINEGEDKILKAMAPYTIKADPNQYCATFTHEQFRGVVKEKQEARELGGETKP